MTNDALTTRRDQLRVLRARIEKELAEIDDALNRRPPTKRSRKVLPECGTESAYQRHRYYGEPQDDACKEAHAAHNRARYQEAS
jgi:hypothetical protein